MQIGKLLPILAIGILFVIISCSTQTGENTSVRSELLSFIDTDGHKIPVITKAEWNQKRLQILDDMQKGMGKLPGGSGLPDFDLHYTDSLGGNNYKRYSINFLVAKNERVTAYLYLPIGKKDDQRIPAMLALHETDQLGKGSVDGQGKNINLAYAKELAQRGYIVIAPDYPDFGESQTYDFENDRYESGTMKGIFNHMRCIDLLQSMPEVDPERIGVIGHSLGGHNSIFVGAFDERLKVVVSSCGWTGYDFYNIGEEGAKKYGGRLGPWAQDRYMPLLREKYNLDVDKIPFDFDEIIAAIAPRVFFSSSPVNDSNFDVKGVQYVMGDVTNVYRFLDVPGNLHVYYPDCKHDFPIEMRTRGYALIDSVLQHKPANQLN
jgi:pimeloyl-ACP methyl ester carboxylesterase